MSTTVVDDVTRPEAPPDDDWVSIWDKIDLLIFRSPRTKKLRIGVSPAALRARRIASFVAVFALVAALGTALVWWMTGGHLFTMTTPSMSPLIPVGALMATQPAHFPLHVGEIVAFRPPMMGGTVYVHKIYAISYAHGQVLYRTKGVLNSSADPWFITRSDVLGKVVWWGDGLGWAIRCLPWFALSFVVIYGFFRWMKVMDSVAFFAAIDYALYVTLFIVNPLVHIQLLALIENNHHSASAWIVNTGLLDIRLHYNGAYHLLQAGHVTSFTAVGQNIVRNGKIYIPGQSAMRWWQLLIEIVLIGAPIVAIVVSRFFRRASPEEIAEWQSLTESIEVDGAAAATVTAAATAAVATAVAVTPAVDARRNPVVTTTRPTPIAVPTTAATATPTGVSTTTGTPAKIAEPTTPATATPTAVPTTTGTPATPAVAKAAAVRKTAVGRKAPASTKAAVATKAGVKRKSAARTKAAATPKAAAKSKAAATPKAAATTKAATEKAAATRKTAVARKAAVTTKASALAGDIDETPGLSAELSAGVPELTK
jgi:signal peptidase I